MCQAVEKAFDVICETFEKELLRDGLDTPLSKACQISIDSTTFALASDTLWIIIEKILGHFHWAESIDTDLPRSISHVSLISSLVVYMLPCLSNCLYFPCHVFFSHSLVCFYNVLGQDWTSQGVFSRPRCHLHSIDQKD